MDAIGTIILVIIIILIIIFLLGINQKNKEISKVDKFVENEKRDEIEKSILRIKQSLVNYQIAKDYINKYSKYDGDKVINTINEYQRLNITDNIIVDAYMDYKKIKPMDIYDINDAALIEELKELYNKAINFIEQQK